MCLALLYLSLQQTDHFRGEPDLPLPPSVNLNSAQETPRSKADVAASYRGYVVQTAVASPSLAMNDEFADVLVVVAHTMLLLVGRLPEHTSQ